MQLSSSLLRHHYYISLFVSSVKGLTSTPFVSRSGRSEEKPEGRHYKEVSYGSHPFIEPGFLLSSHALSSSQPASLSLYGLWLWSVRCLSFGSSILSRLSSVCHLTQQHSPPLPQQHRDAERNDRVGSELHPERGNALRGAYCRTDDLAHHGWRVPLEDCEILEVFDGALSRFLSFLSLSLPGDHLRQR